MDAVRVGIAGVGGMGSMHARMLLEGKVPGAELRGVSDLDPERLKAFPDVQGWTDPQAMFADGGLDAVLIATPHYDHVPLGIAALEAGLHLLVEKPIAVHKADAERLIAAHAGRSSQVFAAMFNQRTDLHYQWVRARIADGTLGPIQRVCWTTTQWFRTDAYYASGGWRATWAGEGGGVLLNQCPHQLDLWQWMFGMPVRINAFCHLGRFHQIEVEDDVTAYLEYADGMSGVFMTTTGEAPGTNRLEIAADKGRVVIEGDSMRFDRNEVAASEFCANAEGPFASPRTSREDIHVGGSGEQHLGIWKNFVAAIQGREALLAPAPEGIHSVELANAMLLSGMTGKSIDLPLDAAAYEAHLKTLIESSTFEKEQGKTAAASAEDMAQSF